MALGVNEEAFCQNLATFARCNPNLVLLRLSGMNLGSGLMTLKREGIEQSKSLLSIHLSGNHYDRDTLFEYEQLAAPNKWPCNDAHTHKSLYEIEEL